jgi:hypothetical protein
MAADVLAYPRISILEQLSNNHIGQTIPAYHFLYENINVLSLEVI